MERVAVPLVGVEPHGDIEITVKANVHGNDAERKLMVNYTHIGCVAITLVGVEPHEIIVVPKSGWYGVEPLQPIVLVETVKVNVDLEPLRIV
ncbi:hypothetical protein MTR67_015215 [Solanum verrucosum]|uniref:Uncharacterized protein n=1 Tax=Solanum verrucosum TaxID=315347 RepID=A0AAF0QGG5_SOLVR|nr:hypothetical protein MTR67_015215 [Solanum verrucosum]